MAIGQDSRQAKLLQKVGVPCHGNWGTASGCVKSNPDITGWPMKQMMYKVHVVLVVYRGTYDK